MPLLGLGIDIWRNTPGAAGGPSTNWVLSAGGVLATLDINFQTNQAYNSGSLVSISSLLACTRASAGYYQDAAGVLINFPNNNTLRYGTNGLLVEESRTNLFLGSNFTQNWNPNNATLAIAAIVAPDGATTGATLTSTNTSSVQVRETTTLATSTQYTWSVYAKFDTCRWLRMRCLPLDDGASFANASCWFDLQNGVVGTRGLLVTSSSIQALANGWYRCIATGTTQAGAITNNLFDIGQSNADNSNNATNGQVLDFWGAQIEVGAFPTSYIPTTTVAVARAADNISFSDVSWMNTNPMSAYAQASYAATTYGWVLTLKDAGLQNERIMFFNSNTKPRVVSTSGGVTDGDASVSASVAANTTVKFAAAWALNDLAITLNGGTVATDATAATPGTMTIAKLGISDDSTQFLNGLICRVAVWKNSRLSNTTLQVLTT